MYIRVIDTLEIPVIVGDGVDDMLTIEKGGAVFEYCCACAKGIKASRVSTAMVITSIYLLVIIFDIGS